MAPSAGHSPSTAQGTEREYLGSTSARLYRRLYRRLSRYPSRTLAEGATGYTAIEGRLSRQAGHSGRYQAQYSGNQAQGLGSRLQSAGGKAPHRRTGTHSEDITMLSKQDRRTRALRQANMAQNRDAYRYATENHCKAYARHCVRSHWSNRHSSRIAGYRGIQAC